MNKRTVLFITILFVVVGSLTKLYYIHYTETWERQHDVISFGADEGHACYIEYICNNKALPDFDPREKWGFFQPPLHHILSAVVLGTSRLLGFSEKRSQENIQILTCIYMILVSVFTVLFYTKISGIKDKTGIALAALIVSFHPIFILLSGSINNDALAVILSIVSLFTAAVWYEKPTYLYTALLALLIGLSMFTKLTGGLTAVPIGILIVMKCLCFDNSDDKDKKLAFKERLLYFKNNYLIKIIVFAFIVFPVGLFVPIRNKIKWGVPINYIPPVGEMFPDSIKFFDRIFDIRTKSVYPYITRTHGDAYDEFNIPLLMIKSSIFGEYNYSEYGRLINLSAKVLFAVTIVLMIICLYATVKVMLDKKILSIKWKVLLFGTYITYLLAYLYFAYSSRSYSAGDFRYSAIDIMIESIFLGLYIDKCGNKKIRYAVTALAVLFAGSSFVTYTMLGIRS